MTVAFSGTEFDESDGVDEAIATATAAGIDAIEMWYPKNYRKDTVAGTIAKLADAGMTTICISTPTSLYGARRNESTALLHEALELAERHGVGLVNTYFGNAPFVDDAAAGAAYTEAVKPIVRRAESLGVTIVLENEFDAFGWDPAGSDVTRRPSALAELCRRIDSPAFGLTFDPANFRCASVDAVHEALPALAADIRYVHVKDVVKLADDGPADDWPRYTDHGDVYRTVRLGDGEVGWADLVADLSAHGYAGHYTLEPHSSRHRLRDETVYARNLITTLIGGVTR
jgi:sugar phosphate isomerase/epimerase